MHQILYEKLRINTFLLQFYGFLARGFFSRETRISFLSLIESNIDRLKLMRDDTNWDGRYDLTAKLLFQTEQFVNESRNKLKYTQICEDIDIANYVNENQFNFFNFGIQLKDLKNILDIEVFFRNGYMLHDVFNGYSEENLYNFQIDCIDYLYSSSNFYNEAYDYYYRRKEIKLYDAMDSLSIPSFEMTRIQPREEVMFRNFRESYINLIFFIESFINSIGFDAYLRGTAKNIDDENILKGIKSINPKNGRKSYCSIKDKLERFPKIIANNTIDIGIDPYKSYLNISVELRNQYVHSSHEKGKALLSVDDWKKKCDEMIEHQCFDLLNEYWKSCYPNQSFPKIIFNAFYGNSFKGHHGRFFVIE